MSVEVIVEPAVTAANAEALDPRVAYYLQQAKAPNTQGAYRSDLQDFMRWCDAQGVPAVPATAKVVAKYLTDLADAGLKVATVQRRLTAINHAHEAVGLPVPTKNPKVRGVMSGIRRKLGTAQRCKQPLLTEDIRSMVMAMSDGLLDQRDRALVLLGFAGAFRRSELVALQVEDLTITREGAVLVLRRSKTDQAGHGFKKGIPWGRDPQTCPVTALKTWLASTGITQGPIFRPVDRHGNLQAGALSDKAVARAVKRWAKRVGLDPDQVAGHSLRAGCATQAAIGGASERVIMNQTGHTSITTVRRYIRDGSLFRDNAADRLGL